MASGVITRENPTGMGAGGAQAGIQMQAVVRHSPGSVSVCVPCVRARHLCGMMVRLWRLTELAPTPAALQGRIVQPGGPPMVAMSQPVVAQATIVAAQPIVAQATIVQPGLKAAGP
jgi:hypothetical protein